MIFRASGLTVSQDSLWWRDECTLEWSQFDFEGWFIESVTPVMKNNDYKLRYFNDFLNRTLETFSKIFQTLVFSKPNSADSQNCEIEKLTEWTHNHLEVAVNSHIFSKFTKNRTDDGSLENFKITIPSEVFNVFKILFSKYEWHPWSWQICVSMRRLVRYWNFIDVLQIEIFQKILKNECGYNGNIFNFVKENLTFSKKISKELAFLNRIVEIFELLKLEKFSVLKPLTEIDVRLHHNIQKCGILVVQKNRNSEKISDKILSSSNLLKLDNLDIVAVCPVKTNPYYVWARNLTRTCSETGLIFSEGWVHSSSLTCGNLRSYLSTTTLGFFEKIDEFSLENIFDTFSLNNNSCIVLEGMQERRPFPPVTG